jgi:hypothetical protein
VAHPSWSFLIGGACSNSFVLLMSTALLHAPLRQCRVAATCCGPLYHKANRSAPVSHHKASRIQSE